MHIDLGNNQVEPLPTEVEEVVCVQCMEDMFAFGKTCYSCPVGCSVCSFDPDSSLWTEVASFWTTSLNSVTAFLTNDPIASAEIPDFDPVAVTEFEKLMWIQLYFVFNYVQDSATTDLVITIQTIFPIHASIQGVYDVNEEFVIFANYINAQTGESWTGPELQDFFAEQISPYTGCS